MPRDLLAEVDAPAGRDLLAGRDSAPAAPARSVVGDLARQVGLTARAGIQGVAAVPAMLANAPAAVYNKIADFLSPPTLSSTITGDRGFRFPDQHAAVSDLLIRIGLPTPENATERVAGDAAGAMAGGAGIAKLGGNLVTNGATELSRKIGEALATNAGTQIVGSGTGAAAAGATREAGGGPVAQMAAGVAGGFVPAIPSALGAAVRNVVRGGEAGRQQVADTIKTFEDAGAGTPTVGQATQGRGGRAIESGLAKTPGAAGRIVAKAESEAAGMSTKVEDMAAQLAARSGAAPAGRQIKAGLDHFVDDFTEKSGQLYDQVDQYIPKDTRVDVSNTRDTMAKLNSDIPGAPNLSKWFKNSKIQGIEGALKADTSGMTAVEADMPIFSLAMLKTLPYTDAERKTIVSGFDEGKLPYEALKKLRTLVGHEISDSTIASDVPKSKWKPLYAALSQDMGNAARTAGPEADRSFVRASNYYRSGIKRLEDTLQPVMGKGDPEDIFNAALSGTKEGATTLQGVMKSLPDESRKVVAATAMRRLGLATPGKQNDLGETFSTESFLTNWNKLHPDAKAVLFSTLPRQMKGDLDQIAKVASNIREGSKVFANPSGTAQATSNQMTAGAAVLSALTGNWHVAGGIVGGVAAANGAARLMTNPKVVHWLAESSRVPIEQLPAQLNILSQMTWNMKREDRDEAQGLVRTMRDAAIAAEPATRIRSKQ